MRLRARIARIERIEEDGLHGRAIKLTFPAGRVGATPERLVTRNIGPRPWSEASYWKDGCNVVIYSK